MLTGRKNRIQGSKGSLTIEAAITYPFFLMIIVTILYIMRVVYVYGLIQHAVDQTAKELSMYTYIYQVSGANELNQSIQTSTSDRTSQFNTDVENVVTLYEEFSDGDFSGSYDGTTDPKEILKNVGSVLLGQAGQELNNQMFTLVVKPLMSGYIGADSSGNSADERLQLLRVVGGLDGLNYSSSHFFEDGVTVDLVVCYTIDPIFPIDIMPDMNLMNRAYVRGVSGKNIFTNTTSETTESTETTSSIWDSNSDVNRGKTIQTQQGDRNLPDNFPVYCYYDSSTGTAKAATSMDLRDSSYQSSSGILSKLKSECSKMDNFKKGTNGDVTITADDIKNQVLIVYIPSSTGDRQIDRTAYDQAVQELKEYYPDIQIVTKEID